MSDKHQRPPKKKPQGGQAKGFPKSGAHSKAKDRRQFNGGDHSPQPDGRRAKRAMNRVAQVVLLLDLIRRAPRNTFELHRLGMASPATRVQDLEALGFVIDPARVVAVDSDGFSHAGVALYSLVAEPTGFPSVPDGLYGGEV